MHSHASGVPVKERLIATITPATPVRKTSRLWAGLSAVPFASLHVASAGVFFVKTTPVAVWLCVALYWLRMFGITAGYPRYFSHRAYSTSRVFQFVLACL